MSGISQGGLNPVVTKGESNLYPLVGLHDNSTGKDRGDRNGNLLLLKKVIGMVKALVSLLMPGPVH